MTNHTKEQATDALRTQFEALASDHAYGFRRSRRGTYTNPATARDWKWFLLGASQKQQPAPATQQVGEHLFELWWAEYMPDATQDRAWKAWTEAPRTDGVGVATPQPSPTAQAADSQPAVQQGDATRAAARALSDRVAEMCNVDKEDHWECHSDDVLSDAELVVSTYLAARATADSVTAPAGGANWQDISTAPKDGTRFVAVGQNYGLDSETQHTCIAQRLAGCWVEVSEWNGASKLKYLTHWMPLPPLPGSAARKQGENHD